jgi:hypothetical protein
MANEQYILDFDTWPSSYEAGGDWWPNRLPTNAPSEFIAGYKNAADEAAFCSGIDLDTNHDIFEN